MWIGEHNNQESWRTFKIEFRSIQGRKKIKIIKTSFETFEGHSIEKSEVFEVVKISRMINMVQYHGGERGWTAGTYANACNFTSTRIANYCKHTQTYARSQEVSKMRKKKENAIDSRSLNTWASRCGFGRTAGRAVRKKGIHTFFFPSYSPFFGRRKDTWCTRRSRLSSNIVKMYVCLRTNNIYKH